MSRATAVRAVALAAALVLWFSALGLVALVTPWFGDDETVVLDLGWGAVTGLLAPAAFLAQLRRPGTAVAALQQLALCAVAYALAGALADGRYLLLAGAVAAVLVLLLVLHPVGGMFFALPDEVNPLLATLALLPAVPLVLYALDAAERQRADAPPVDVHAGLGSWGGLTAMGLGIALTGALAAARTTGWRVPTWSAAGALAVWGAACVLHPDAPGSEGRIWGSLALAWAVAFVLAARFVARRAAPTE